MAWLGRHEDLECVLCDRFRVRHTKKKKSHTAANGIRSVFPSPPLEGFGDGSRANVDGREGEEGGEGAGEEENSSERPVKRRNVHRRDRYARASNFVPLA